MSFFILLESVQHNTRELSTKLAEVYFSQFVPPFCVDCHSGIRMSGWGPFYLRFHASISQSILLFLFLFWLLSCAQNLFHCFIVHWKIWCSSLILFSILDCKDARKTSNFAKGLVYWMDLPHYWTLLLAQVDGRSWRRIPCSPSDKPLYWRVNEDFVGN